ncbi:MAG: patatin family protein [Clostridia bacterium]|nr:patatin family protein [Clostridia bacterium]
MTGIIDTGGGLRGIYGAGVLDRCLDDSIKFDCCIGVSAGSANLITYAANQRGRTYSFYHDYAFRKEYMSAENFLKSGSYIDLNYIYGTLSQSGGENPLDYKEASGYDGILNFVATDTGTGCPHYFSMQDIPFDDYSVIKASCCIPLVCRPVKIDGGEFYDGGVSDPVPIDRALELGCDKTVVILTRPTGYRKSGKPEKRAGLAIKPFNKEISETLMKSARQYNEGVKKALRLQEEGKCLVIAPDDCRGINTLTRDRKALHDLYTDGYRDAQAIRRFIGKC